MFSSVELFLASGLFDQTRCLVIGIVLASQSIRVVVVQSVLLF
jgi:hypothetical protein